MLFTVNTEVCTRCGLCVADCPTGLLVMTEDGPKTGKGGCISCGHCVAVCPTLALDSDLTPRAEQVDITKETKFTPEQAELFLRSRRSIRNYQNKPVPAELIRKVLNVWHRLRLIRRGFRISSFEINKNYAASQILCSSGCT